MASNSKKSLFNPSTWFQPQTKPANNVTPFPTTNTAPDEQPKGDLIQQTMQQAMSLTEVYESPVGKSVHGIYEVLAYFIPTFIAVAAGLWIGEGYSGTLRWDAATVGVYIISVGGELGLVMLVLGCALAIKQMVSDASRKNLLITAVCVLVFFSVASALAQWFLILNNVKAQGYDTSAIGVIMMLCFRVVMPVGSDVAALIYLSIHGHKSLKATLAQLDLKAEAFEKLHDRRLSMQAKEDKARREREDIEQLREEQRRSHELIVRIQELNAQATLQAIENGMKRPEIVESNDRRQRN